MVKNSPSNNMSKRYYIQLIVKSDGNSAEYIKAKLNEIDLPFKISDIEIIPCAPGSSLENLIPWGESK